MEGASRRAAQGVVTLYSAQVMRFLEKAKHDLTRGKCSRIKIWNIPSSPSPISVLLLHDTGPRPNCNGDVVRFQNVPIERMLLHAIRE